MDVRAKQMFDKRVEKLRPKQILFLETLKMQSNDNYIMVKSFYSPS